MVAQEFTPVDTQLTMQIDRDKTSGSLLLSLLMAWITCFNEISSNVRGAVTNDHCDSKIASEQHLVSEMKHLFDTIIGKNPDELTWWFLVYVIKQLNWSPLSVTYYIDALRISNRVDVSKVSYTCASLINDIKEVIAVNLRNMPVIVKIFVKDCLLEKIMMCKQTTADDVRKIISLLVSCKMDKMWVMESDILREWLMHVRDTLGLSEAVNTLHQVIREEVSSSLAIVGCNSARDENIATTALSSICHLQQAIVGWLKVCSNLGFDSAGFVVDECKSSIEMMIKSKEEFCWQENFTTLRSMNYLLVYLVEECQNRLRNELFSLDMITRFTEKCRDGMVRDCVATMCLSIDVICLMLDVCFQSSTPTQSQVVGRCLINSLSPFLEVSLRETCNARSVLQQHQLLYSLSIIAHILSSHRDNQQLQAQVAPSSLTAAYTVFTREFVNTFQENRDTGQQLILVRIARVTGMLQKFLDGGECLSSDHLTRMCCILLEHATSFEVAHASESMMDICLISVSVSSKGTGDKDDVQTLQRCVHGMLERYWQWVRSLPAYTLIHTASAQHIGSANNTVTIFEYYANLYIRTVLQLVPLLPDNEIISPAALLNDTLTDTTLNPNAVQIIIQAILNWQDTNGNSPMDEKMWNVMRPILVFGLLYQHDYNKDGGVGRAAIAYISETWRSNKHLTRLSMSSLHQVARIRVLTLQYVTSLKPGGDIDYISSLVEELLKRDEALVVSSCNKNGKSSSSYIGSKEQMLRLCIWQSVTCLVCRCDAAYSRRLLMKLLERCLRDDTCDELTRRYMEWTAMLLVYQFPRVLWCDVVEPRCLQTQPVPMLQSLATIISHLPRMLPQQCHDDHESHAAILQRAATFLTHSAVGGHFKTASWARACYRSLKESVATTLPHCTAYLPLTPQGMQKVHQNHVYITAFHPVDDYNLKTILYILPKIYGVPDCDQYRACTTNGKSGIIGMANNGLALCLDMNAHTRITDKTARNAEMKADSPDKGTVGRRSCDDLSNMAEALNIQRKAVATNHDSSRISTGELVVVASLLEKEYNLGGLTRTCETQGVATLAVPAADVVQGKEYRSVSLTGEQWLPIEEVKAAHLSGYLSEMRCRGYTVVGVEQASNSVELYSYQFPRKCVILVGNESRGIPAALLCGGHIDACVEIRQYGVIKSLNAHVATAMVIYEYNKQHMK